MKIYTIFVFGIDYAGKSSLIDLVKNGTINLDTKPTFTFNVQKFVYENVEFIIWDAPGQMRLRESWPKGFETAKILIFVLDISEKNRFQEAKNEFLKVLNNPTTQGLPILFCFHKIDLQESKKNIIAAHQFFDFKEFAYRNIIPLETSIRNPDCIYEIRNALLELVLVRAKKAEALINIFRGICHDVRNQVGIIKMVSELLKEKETNSESLDFVNNIESAVNQTILLINKFNQNFNESNKKPELIDMRKIIQDSALFISRGTNCEFVFTFDSDIPLIEIEPEKIIQIVNNLLINATEAMPKGGRIFITLKNQKITTQNFMSFGLSSIPSKNFIEGNFIQIIIEDSGIGIPLSEQEKIFTMYYTTKEKGHGLGLANIFSIITLNNGYINFNSIENKGTTFNVFLPIRHMFL